MRLTFFFVFFVSLAFGQDKPVVFYNEAGEKISKETFIKTRNYHKNFDLYFENDTTQIGVLVTRQKFGQLDKQTFVRLKTYLKQLTDKSISDSQYIVINYLTANPKKAENKKSRSGWNIFHGDYLRKLHKTADIKQFWMYSTNCDNLDYHYQNKVHWVPDKTGLLKRLFSAYEVPYGYYVLIKPDGKYFYSLGEYGKHDVWENAEKFFK